MRCYSIPKQENHATEKNHFNINADRIVPVGAHQL